MGKDVGASTDVVGDMVVNDGVVVGYEDVGCDVTGGVL